MEKLTKEQIVRAAEEQGLHVIDPKIDFEGLYLQSTKEVAETREIKYAAFTITQTLRILGKTAEEHMMDVLMDNCNDTACCEATCDVEPDGYCSHGHPSLSIALGII